MLIHLVAAPSVRNLCPPEYTEGLWLDIPESATRVDFAAPGAGLYVQDADDLDARRDGYVAQEDEIPLARLMAKPTGKMIRDEALLSAPVFEIRLAEDWGEDWDDSDWGDSDTDSDSALDAGDN